MKTKISDSESQRTGVPAKDEVESLYKEILASTAYGEGRPAAKTLLEQYVQMHPDSPSASSSQINMVNHLLENCILKDRTLWKSQKYLHLPPKDKGERRAGLEVLRLPSLLDKEGKYAEQFWLYQCSNFDPQKTVVVIPEPLFFYSPLVHGYVRFLEVNHGPPIEREGADRLVGAAEDWLFTKGREEISKRIADDRNRRRPSGKDRFKQSMAGLGSFIEMLQLKPVRHYVPAGDGHAMRAIRAWFEKVKKAPPLFKVSTGVTLDEPNVSNLILLGNARNMPLIDEFQTKNPDLPYQIVERGVRKQGQTASYPNDLYNDEYSTEGCSKAFVLVTNSVSKHGRVSTIISSNHARAGEAVVGWLTDDDKMVRVRLAFRSSEGIVPRRFQLLFSVELTSFESAVGEITHHDTWIQNEAADRLSSEAR